MQSPTQRVPKSCARQLSGRLRMCVPRSVALILALVSVVQLDAQSATRFGQTDWKSIGLDSVTLLAGKIGAHTLPFPDIAGAPPPSRLSAQHLTSVARLRVPRKARQLYEKAAKPFRKHDYVEAQKKLDQALHLYPAFPEALSMQGFIQMDTNHWQEAEHSLQAAVQTDSTYGWAYLLLSDLYNRQQRFDDALATSQRAVQLIPELWVARYEMCQAFLGKHEYALALSVSGAALSTNRGTLLHVARAHALIGLGRYREAMLELRTYLCYQPAGEGSHDAHELLEEIKCRAASSPSNLGNAPNSWRLPEGPLAQPEHSRWIWN